MFGNRTPTPTKWGSAWSSTICGNDYRLICRMTYANDWTAGTLLVKHFLTHAQYDKRAWCKDCLPQTRKTIWHERRR
jgi:hypothetical protein